MFTDAGVDQPTHRVDEQAGDKDRQKRKPALRLSGLVGKIGFDDPFEVEILPARFLAGRDEGRGGFR